MADPVDSWFPSAWRALAAQHSGPAFFATVSAIGPVVGLITGTLTARWLTPAEFGAIQTALLLSPYLTFLAFGVYHGLNRDYPYLIGKGQPERALEMVGASALATKFITGVTFLVATAYAILVSLRSADRSLAIAVWAAIPIVCVYPLSTHYEVLFRTRDDFMRFGWVQAFGYIISIATLALVYVGHFYGQCLRLVVVSMLNLGLRWQWRPLKAHRPGNWEDVRILTGVGFPLLIAGYLQGILAVADRSVIALKLGPEAVGYYSLTGIVLASMLAFPMAIAQVVLPRASTTFGSSGRRRDIRRWLNIMVVLNFLVLVPMAVLGWFTLPVLVSWLLPQYTSGVAAAQVGLIAGALSVPGLAAIFLVLQHNRFYIVMLGLCTALVWLGSSLVLARGGDLVSISWVRVAATALLTAATLTYAFHLTR